MDIFLERINVNLPLDTISKLICEKCNITGYISSRIVEVGYEDFNIIITTKVRNYFVKIFNKNRTNVECENYIDRIKLSNEIGINAPKVLYIDSIQIEEKTLKFVVLEYIDGKSFMELSKIPNADEIKEIIRQMSLIHKAKLNSNFIYDSWAIVNYSNEFSKKNKFLDKQYYNKFKELSDRLAEVDYSRLPHSFVHGDIITSNVLKDKENKLWIIDFAVSNYLPRIIDLVVTGYNLCQNPNSKKNTIDNLKLMISEYEKYNKLTDYEKEIIPLFYDIGNAMGILQINYLKQNGEYSEEDEYWLNISKNGLEYTKTLFWDRILK